MSPMDLREVFDDVYFSATRPELVAARDSVSRRLRWVHASEQLDIAPLLRGGELILLEGANFGARSDGELVAYLDSLQVAGVVGIAVETTDRLQVIPQVLLDHAERIGFPIVRLRRRVPFVQICESVNSQLADSALRRLQMADRMSRVLSASMEAEDSVDAILAALSRETRSSVVLRSVSGDLIGEVGTAVTHSEFTTFDTRVCGGGTVLATLTFVPDSDSDIYLINAGLERAPEILAIALLSARPTTAADRLHTRFFSLLTASDHSASDLAIHFAEVAERLGLPVNDAYLSLMVDLGGSPPSPALQMVVDEVTRRSVCHVLGDEYVAVLQFDGWADLEVGRDILISLLAQSNTCGSHAVVGPGAVDRHGVRRCVSTARAVHSLADTRHDGAVLDTRDYAVAQLVSSLTEESAVTIFIDEQIGALLQRDRERHGELFATLLAYITHWGSKTETAKSLGIQRQTLYQRLERVFAILGPLPAGSARIPGIATAAFLEQARRQRHGSPQSST